MIDVQDLSKDYMQKHKDPGLSGALKGLVKPEYKVVHAVRDLSFHIGEGEIVGRGEEHDDQDDVGDPDAH